MAEMRERGAEVWVACPDEGERLAAFRDEAGLDFPILVDAGAEVARRYGVLNESNPTVPHPTALVIDRQGVVRWLRVDEDYKVRPPAEDLIAALDALGE